MLKYIKTRFYVTKRAVAVNFVENDSVYIHGKKNGYGKEGNRIIRAFNNVRFYKTDMSGANVIRFIRVLKLL
jgi:hypothetical protein